MTSRSLSPSSLSHPSPQPSSPNDSSEQHNPRKRPRSEISPEERKEARAHRNRIAAQNSRDRRKAQFSYFERRVAELEEENRQLRISIGLLSQGQSVHPVPVVPMTVLPSTSAQSTPVSVPLVQSIEDVARDRENAELKERIRTLERGWDAVIKALTAQGLPTGLASLHSTTTSTAPSTPSPPVSSTKPPTAAFPSPAPTVSSLDFDVDISNNATPSSHTPPLSMPVFVPTSSTSPCSTPSLSQSRLEIQPLTPSPDSHSSSTSQDSTRHLARVANTGASRPVSQQRVDLRSLSVMTPWEMGLFKTMEELLNQILVSLPSAETMSSQNEVDGQKEGKIDIEEKDGKESRRKSLREYEIECRKGDDNAKPHGHREPGEKDESTDARVPNATGGQTDSNDEPIVDWANEIEMQRILDAFSMIQQQPSSAVGTCNPMGSAFGLDEDFTMSGVPDLGLVLGWNPTTVTAEDLAGADVF